MSERASYRDIKARLLSRIRSGEWSPGELIPKEQEFATAFGCARLTVHRALRELAKDGVVERRRRGGTRVALQTTRTAVIEIPRIDREIEATGAQYGYELVSWKIQVPDAAIAEQLRIPQSAEKPEALYIVCMHHADDMPFALEHRWINLDVVPEAADQSFTRTPPNVWLLERLPWSNIEHVISAVNATPQSAERLHITSGDALMQIERRTFLEERIITFVRLLHPGQFYRLQTVAQPLVG